MSKLCGQRYDVLVECLSDKNTPHCPHGPTLLFERYSGGKKKTERFYACSACRDRKLCNFYQEANAKVSNAALEARKEIIKKQQPIYNSRQCMKRLKHLKQAKEYRFCHSCNLLLLPDEWSNHKVHILRDNLTEAQIQNPSTFLSPWDNNKSNAQFLFTDETCELLVEFIKKLKLTKVLCIGTPRLHEKIMSDVKDTKNQLSSLLLDIDHRYSQFYDGNSFCRYNMFNHHFFDGDESKQIFTRYVTTNSEQLLVCIDPPFGGLVQVLAHTLKTITASLESNELPAAYGGLLPTIWLFPYYLESKITEVLPFFSMSDYKVNYTNHLSYQAGPKGRKLGSPVRLFTNVPLHNLKLPESQGYRWCEKCNKSVQVNNLHCDICDACPSKDGSSYKHCCECGKCVKPSRVHCQVCNICVVQDHKCGDVRIIGCHICGDISHKKRECPKRHEIWKKNKGQKRKHIGKEKKHKKRLKTRMGKVEKV